jgi:acyl-[acyl carrier protein]--UDP-N-acetylglucosamine O-acyltransferase
LGFKNIIMDLYDKYFMFDESNQIHDTAVIYPNVIMGKNNIIGAYAVIGSNGEIRGVNQNEFKGTVIIGDNNVISELVTIQRPFEATSTEIGSNNIIMRGVHLGHDSKVGNNCELCCNVILGGYAEINDNAKIKLGAIIRNRKKIGKNCIVGMGSVVIRDVEENYVVVGNPAREIRCVES